MATKKNLSPEKTVYSHKKLKEARKMQYGKDFKVYEFFARIWGWDGYKEEPKRAVKQLSGFIQNEERKTDVEKQRPQDPELQFYVGIAYLSNWIPCEEPRETALDWFERSSEQGSDKGALGVGYLLEAALESDWDIGTYKRMVDQYIIAAKQGNIYAQFRLAKILHQRDPDNPRVGQMLMNAADAGYKPAKNLLSEIKQESAQMKQIQISSHDFDELKELLLQILGITSESLILARRIEQKLEMLQFSMNGMWDDLRAAEAEHADQITKLQKSVNESLKDAIKLPRPKGCNPDIMVDAEKFMTLIFGEDWRNPERLCDESCDALVSAHVLMSVAEELKITNYSGIVITAVWALEHECRRRFHDAFDRYLESIGVGAQDRPSRMHLRDKNGKFTLGSVGYVTYSTDFNDFSQKSNLLSEVAKKEQRRIRFSDAEMIWKYRLSGTCGADGKEKSFKNLVEELNNEHRKPAAHAEIVSKEMANECCNLLGITKTHQKTKNEAQEKKTNVEGALKALLWLTAPLDKPQK